MSLDTVLGTDIQVIDLILDFLDNDSILSINRVCKRWVPKRSIVVKRKYGNLTKLDLNLINLTAISKEIGQLHNLRYLCLNNNDLKTIPKEIGELQNLRYLFLHNNNLRGIPSEIGRLQNLQKCDISSNLLIQIPKEVKDLRKNGCVINMKHNWDFLK